MNNESILYVSRPFLNDYSGTGEQRVAAQVVDNIQKQEHHIDFVKKFFIKPYHGILSLLFYDFVVPLYLSIKNLFHPHSTVIFNSPYQGIFVRIFNLRSKTSCICNDLFFTETDTPNSFDKYSAVIHRYVLINSNRVITTTNETSTKITKNYNVRPVVGLLGTDYDDEPYFKRLPNATIGYIGSYVSRKRPEYLIKLAEKLDEAHMVLAGNITDDYKKLLSNNNKVTILGQLTQEAKRIFYSDISYLYFPTRSEGFGLPLIDAMKLGVIPIVQSDAAIPRVVKDRCIKVDAPKDVIEIIKLYQSNTSDYTKLTTDNYKYAKKFNWHKFTNTLITD